MSQIDVLGSDLSRNFILEGLTDLQVVSGSRSVKESIETLLLTSASNPNTKDGGERIFNRDVGLNIIRFLFISDSNRARANIINELLKLNDLEPRIVIDRSGISVNKDILEPNKWIIKLSYYLVDTGLPENRVFPILAKDGFIRILPDNNIAGSL